MTTGRTAFRAERASSLARLEDLDFAWMENGWTEPNPVGRRAGAPASLSGVLRITHRGREYAASYEVRDGLLTVYCALACTTGAVPSASPSPKPFAERLLREMIDAEHPGLEAS